MQPHTQLIITHRNHHTHNSPYTHPHPHHTHTRYKALAGELVIAGVFVRVYDEQPSFPVSNPAALCRGLVTYLHNTVRAPDTNTSPTCWLPTSPTDTDNSTGLPTPTTAGKPAWVLQREHLLCTLRALSKLLEAVPKVSRLLTTPATLAPLFNCLEPAIARSQQQGARGGDAQGGGGIAGGTPQQKSTSMTTSTSSTTPSQPHNNNNNLQTMPIAVYEAQVATGALAALVRCTQLAACVEAMASVPRNIMLALWIVHRPPSHACLVLALRLLHALAPTAAAAWAAGCHAGAIYLLTQLLPVDPTIAAATDDNDAQHTVRVACASLLGRLIAQPLHGPRVRLLLQRLLPEGLVASLADGPAEASVSAFRESAETPERLWTRDMAATAAVEIDALAWAACDHQRGGGGGSVSTPNKVPGTPPQKAGEDLTSRDSSSLDYEWSPPEGFVMPYQFGTAGQALLCVGGVYVQLYLREPQYPLRDPKAFMEGLLQMFLAAGGGKEGGVAGGGVQDTEAVLLVGSAATALCKVCGYGWGWGCGCWCGRVGVYVGVGWWCSINKNNPPPTTSTGAPATCPSCSVPRLCRQTHKTSGSTHPTHRRPPPRPRRQPGRCHPTSAAPTCSIACGGERRGATGHDDGNGIVGCTGMGHGGPGVVVGNTQAPAGEW